MWNTSNVYDETTSENGDNEEQKASYIKEDHIEV